VKLLFDQNLSPKLVTRFADLFPESRHVREAGLSESEDSDVWTFAGENGFAIVSKTTISFNCRSFEAPLQR
jgi:predicted nuclease of predicted toxin-antitoxin system